MRTPGRKSAPKVVDGKVQKKNNHALTYASWRNNRAMPVIERERPGKGEKHLLTTAEVEQFLEILPAWEELAKGLRVVLLAGPYDGAYGWCSVGTVAICSWKRTLWETWPPRFYKENRRILELLNVEVVHHKGGEGTSYEIRFTENQAKGYQLLSVLLHELGHHHDRMLHPGRECNGGEPHADAYERKYMDVIWPEYVKRFPVY